ncbi:unnamed protein product [Amoebophrya sp. A120]|nr:unnamed protein product [Amoebophrya sp. A120]|eukprot:GSA120T00002476001.1
MVGVLRTCFTQHPMVCQAVEAVTELPAPLAEKYAPFPMGPGVLEHDIADGHGDGVFGDNFKGIFKTANDFGGKPKYFAIWDYPPPPKEMLRSLERLKVKRDALDLALNKGPVTSAKKAMHGTPKAPTGPVVEEEGNVVPMGS